MIPATFPTNLVDRKQKCLRPRGVPQSHWAEVFSPSSRVLPEGLETYCHALSDAEFLF